MLQNPPMVTIYDIARQTTTRTFCFLGNIPNNVRKAIGKVDKVSVDTVTKYYGSKNKLIPNHTALNTHKQENNKPKKGGYKHSDTIRIFGNIYDTDCVRAIAAQSTARGYADTRVDTPPNDVCIAVIACDRIYPVLGAEHMDSEAVLLSRDQLETARCIPDAYFRGGDDNLDDIEQLLNAKPKQSVQHQGVLVFEPGVEYVERIHMYPEDRYSEVMDKIYLATGIPTYRQHLFYFTESGIATTYTIADMRVDIVANVSTTIYGLPVDRAAYDNRHTISIHAQDTFATLASTHPNTCPQLYVVDLAAALAPARAQTENMMRDEYQFELVYFGFIIKYWPRLTRACFRDYISDESDLYLNYPELARPRAALASIYAAERDIIDKNASSKKSSQRANISHAITSMAASVSSLATINIRNLFDNLATSDAIPEIRARVEHDRKRYILTKRYDYAKTSVVFPIVVSGIYIAIVGAAGTVFLNVLPHGKYHIRATWPEEDHMDFPDAIASLARAVNKVIETINTFSNNVFIIGKSLPALTKYNIEFTGLNVCMLWKKVMLESAFKAVKAAFEPYIAAAIMSPRNAGYDRAEFMWRKGMYEFDGSILDRILGTFNQYLYLSDQTVRAKWVQQYDGRILRVIHRTTDVKFEIVGVHEEEFKTVYAYLSTFINNTSAIITYAPTSNVRKLRKLREQDPELFNIKKYGTTKVYSRICQKKQQPTIYTADEIEQMPAREVARLIKYWNFTLNKPAYYACPNRQYPHLSFITGVHPKHYCLPCCNKKPAHVDNKKQRIINTCLAEHMYVDDDVISTKHVIRYGKVLEPGRLSKVPDGSMSTLLLNTCTAPHGWYIYGVVQNNFGMLHAVAAALEMESSELIEGMVELLGRPQVFNSLLDGAIAADFASAAELIVAMRAADTAMISLGSKFTRYADLVVDIMAHNDISVFEFVDRGGANNDHVEFISRGIIRSKSIFIFNVAGRYYPMFLLDTNEYFKTFHVYARAFAPKHKIMSVVSRMLAVESDHYIDYAAVREHVTVVKKYINRHNLCYGVLCSDNTSTVYLSLDPSPNTPSGVSVTFDAVTSAELSGTEKQLREIMMRVGMKISETMRNGTLISDRGLACYYAGAEISHIDQLILSGTKPDNIEFNAAYNRALHSLFEYQIFVNEFVHAINSEVNTAARERIVEAIRGTNFTKNAAVVEFKTAMKKIMSAGDLAVIMDQVLASHHGRIVDKATLMNFIAEHTYDFDRITLANLQEISTHNDNTITVEQLRKICEKIRAMTPPPTTFPNIYIPGRGITPTDDMLSLLAADLNNPIKRKYMLTKLFTEIIINYFDFIKRPGESISVAIT